jgi:hypothetical protein
MDWKLSHANLTMNEQVDFADALNGIADSFVARAHEEFGERLKKWQLDLAQNEVHEVVGGLLARQLTLASQLANCPIIWSGHVGPLVLRAMADVYISMAWVLGKPTDRSKKFILYGLGQAKLQLEHRQAELKTRKPRKGEKEQIARIENWINRQRAVFLTDVNLGSWSGLSTRKAAQEAGCLDFYNFVYTPFSACTHSMWQHIANYNLKQCENPLHRLHSTPYVSNPPLDSEYLYLAAKYLQKTFAKFDEATGITANSKSAFELLCGKLDDLGKSEQTSTKTDDN